MGRVVVVSGTPGTGKSAVARLLAERLGARYVNLSELVIREGLYTCYDEERESYVIDEEAVRRRVRELADRHELLVVDSHYGEIVPGDLLEAIVVLRLDPEVLEGRLRGRGWGWAKVKENVAAEVMGVCTANAVAEHGPGKVYEVDATGKSTEEVVEEVLGVLGGEGTPGPRIDWLSSKPFERLRRYLE